MNLLNLTSGGGGASCGPQAGCLCELAPRTLVGLNYICISLSLSIYLSMYIPLSLYIYIYIHIMYVCMHVYIYIYTHIHIKLLARAGYIFRTPYQTL